MNAARLLEIIKRFESARILVVGDVMLDEFLRGNVERISPEAPVPVVNIQSRYLLPGGAANVARNVETLGGTSRLVGVIGRDDNADRFKHALEECGIDPRSLIEEPDRPTTTKTRIVAGSQQIVRTDIENTTALQESTRSRLNQVIDDLEGKYDAVIISDYDKGVINKALLTRLVRHANEKNIPIAVDPNVTHFFDYVNVTILTPNLKELETAVGRKLRDETSLCATGKEVLEKLVAGALMVTRGEQGLSLFDIQGHVTHIPTVAKQVYDVTGAGDTVISVLTLALAAGATPLEAAKISNAAAGVVVGKRGTATLNPSELSSRIEELDLEAV